MIRPETKHGQGFIAVTGSAKAQSCGGLGLQLTKSRSVLGSKSDIFVQYEMYDKVSHIQHKILKGKAMFCDKNYSLLVPFVIYSVRNELGHPWGIRLRGKIKGGNLVEILFRSVMPQLGFTIREEQIQMAQTMLEGLGKKKITLYEAGVGTGKTMSYLIAAFLISKMDVTYQFMQNPITIATSSIDLQRELVEKEIPKLSRALMKVGIIDSPLRVVIRKGKDHYFCLRRYYNLIESLTLCPEKHQREIAMLKKLELPALGFDLDAVNLPNYLKQKICVGSSCRNCPQRIMCKYDSYVQSCKGRGASDIQVTNHNMLLMSQKLKACGGNDLLQDSNYIIIDEAHKLIDAANSTYGVELCRDDVLALTDMLKDYVAKSKQEYCRFTDLLDKLEALNKRLFKTILSGITMTEDRESMKLSKPVLQMIDDMIVTINQINKYSLKEYMLVLRPSPEIRSRAHKGGVHAGRGHGD